MAYTVLRNTIVPLLRRRIRVEGIEHLPETGPYILAANHQSYLDPPLVWLAIVPLIKTKIFFITKEYVWRGLKKFLGQRGVDWLGLLPIFSTEKSKVLDLAYQELAKGGRVVVFPEGTRNRNPESVLLKGKTGAARLALATGASLIPIGILSPKGLTQWQAFRNFFFSRQPATIRLGPPLRFPKATEPPTRERLDEVTTAIMAAIGQLCGKRYPL